MSGSKSYDSEQVAEVLKNIEKVYRNSIESVEKKYESLLKIRDEELSLKAAENAGLRDALKEVRTLIGIYKKQSKEKIATLESENRKLAQFIANHEKFAKGESEKMFNGKMKAVTFSYDDCVTQDRRLVKLLNKYGLKCTFNVNSGIFRNAAPIVVSGVTVPHVRFAKEEIKDLYEGHEVAVHTLTHPNLKMLSDADVIREVEEDRKALSEIVGYNVVGMAYPGGTGCMDDRVAKLIEENTGVKYARTTTSTHNFELQTELLKFNPTLHQHAEMDKMFELAKEFIALKPDSPKLFYIWGHSYEIDARDDWDALEEFFALISGHDDIFYGTNEEVLL